MSPEPAWISAKLHTELTRLARVKDWTLPRGWEEEVKIVVQRVLDEEGIGMAPNGRIEGSPYRLF